jgi:hypothetical protein
MWKSDRCSTLSRFPLGCFGDGNGLGFGLANQPVRFNGGVGGSVHEPATKFTHIN